MQMNQSASSHASLWPCLGTCVRSSSRIVFLHPIAMLALAWRVQQETCNRKNLFAGLTWVVCLCHHHFLIPPSNFFFPPPKDFDHELWKWSNHQRASYLHNGYRLLCFHMAGDKFLVCFKIWLLISNLKAGELKRENSDAVLKLPSALKKNTWKMSDYNHYSSLHQT